MLESVEDDFSLSINPSDSVSQLSAVEIKRKGIEIGSIWYHFSKKKNAEHVTCDYCAKPLKKQKNSGTNTYWDHLETCNREMYGRAKGFKPNKKLKVNMEGSVLLESPLPAYSKESFQRCLVEAFVKNSIAFNVLDNDYFRKPFLLISRDVDLMSGITLKRRIMELYLKKKERVIEEFAKEDGKVSITTDCWTSPNKKSFMGVTAHWVDSKFNLCHTTLAFTSLPKKHTGFNLYEKLKEILKEFKLENKLLGVTLDNASNNDAMIDYADIDSDISFTNFAHIRCFAHVVNLGAQSALDVVKSGLEQLRKIIRSIRSTPQSSQDFLDLMQIKKLSQDLLELEVDVYEVRCYKPILDAGTLPTIC